MPGHLDDEFRAATGVRMDLDRTTMSLHDLLHDIKSQSQAAVLLSSAAGCLKGLEDVRQQGGVDRPAVADPEHNGFRGSGLNCDVHPGTVSVVDRVHNKVGQYL